MDLSLIVIPAFLKALQISWLQVDQSLKMPEQNS